MSFIAVLAIIRILAYVGMAGYCLLHRRWWAWSVFTALVFSTYAYRFTNTPELAVECFRTLVGAGLIFITLRRK